MPSIRLRNQDDGGNATTICRAIDVMTIMNVNGISAINALPLEGGDYTVFVNRDEDIQRILNLSPEALGKHKLKPETPAMVTAARSVFCRSVPAYALDFSSEKLAEELIHSTEWLKAKDIIEVSKIDCKSEKFCMLKICFSTEELCKRAQKEGLKGWVYTTPPSVTCRVATLFAAGVRKVATNLEGVATRPSRKKAARAIIPQEEVAKQSTGSKTQKRLTTKRGHSQVRGGAAGGGGARTPLASAVDKNTADEVEMQMPPPAGPPAVTVRPAQIKLDLSDIIHLNLLVLTASEHARQAEMARPGSYQDTYNGIMNRNGAPGICLMETVEFPRPGRATTEVDRDQPQRLPAPQANTPSAETPVENNRYKEALIKPAPARSRKQETPAKAAGLDRIGRSRIISGPKTKQAQTAKAERASSSKVRTSSSPPSARGEEEPTRAVDTSKQAQTKEQPQKAALPSSSSSSGSVKRDRDSDNEAAAEEAEVAPESEGVGDSLKVYGYTVHKSNRSGERNDGVAVATKYGLKCKVLDNFMSETLAVEVDTDTGPVVIATSYLPPRRPYLPWADYNRLAQMRKPVYIAGDLNAKHRVLGHTSRNQVGDGLAGLIADGKLQHIGPNFATYIAMPGSGTPDIVLCNRRAYHNITLQEGPITTSDHIPIVITLSTNPIQTPRQQVYRYGAADWQSFKDTLTDRHVNPPDLQGGTLEEIDDHYSAWSAELGEAMEQHIPKTNHRTTQHTPLTREEQLVHVRYAAIKRHASVHGWTVDLLRRYRNLQQELQEILIRKRNTTWERIIDRLSTQYNDPAKYWRKIKQLSGNTRSPAPYIQDGERVAHTHKEEEMLRNRLINTFQITEEEDENFDLRHDDEVHNELQERSIGSPITPHANADRGRLQPGCPLTSPIQFWEIEMAIKRLRPKAPGSSGVGKQVLERLPVCTKQRLLDIINASFSAGYFPDAFKKATIVMMPKEGKDPREAKNYRPISLLEVPGKLMEKILNLRLRQHLEQTGYHHPEQFGFRIGRGTGMAIAAATELIAQNKVALKQCFVVLRDVSKAFDKVWHTGLKLKILRMGLPDVMTRTLCDFLDDRTASIKIGHITGPAFELQSGVPQGSVLSPTLYICYTADMPPAQLPQADVGFADDISQVISEATAGRMFMAVRAAREIERINRFERQWKITTNVNKFKVIPLAQYKTEDLIIDGEAPVEYSSSGSLLGLGISKRGYRITNKTEATSNQGNYHTNTRLPSNPSARTVGNSTPQAPESAEQSTEVRLQRSAGTNNRTTTRRSKDGTSQCPTPQRGGGHLGTHGTEKHPHLRLPTKKKRRDKRKPRMVPQKPHKG
ncbi:hypothetical protein SNEBB_010833 [Seison nebaliae]|nr:hypothetical protein SNEBB_010833 [Seison nebaliae]